MMTQLIKIKINPKQSIYVIDKRNI